MKKFSGLLLLEDGTAWDAIGYGNEGFGVGELCLYHPGFFHNTAPHYL